MPRAELMAALLNASSGHRVKLAFGAHHTKCWKLTDSQVVLRWINSKKSALKMLLRYRVIEINRLTGVDKWHYVDSKNTIADIGTIKGIKCANPPSVTDFSPVALGRASLPDSAT